MSGAEKVTTTKHMQCQVGLNSTRKVATKLSDTNLQMSQEGLEHEIHHRMPVRCTLLQKRFHH